MACARLVLPTGRHAWRYRGPSECLGLGKRVPRPRLGHKGCVQPRHGLPHHGLLRARVNSGECAARFHLVAYGNRNGEKRAADQRADIDPMQGGNLAVAASTACRGGRRMIAEFYELGFVTC